MTRPILAEAQTTIATRDGLGLRLAIVADTHSAPHPEAYRLLREAAPHGIIHAGDIGDLGVLERLAGIAPVYAVRGNIDVRAADLPDVLTLDIVTGSDDGAPRVRLLVLHIAVDGPRLRADAARRARACDASIVVCGHSHVPLIAREGDTAIFNPGSMGPRRFQLPIVFGILELTDTEVRLRHVDCETGRDWSPATPRLTSTA